MLSWRRLLAQALQIQSRQPPWEVRGNRCASVVSMEIRQTGSLGERPRLVPEAFVFANPFLSVNTEAKLPVVHRDSAFPPGHWSLAEQDTPKQGQVCEGPLMASPGTVGAGSG